MQSQRDHGEHCCRGGVRSPAALVDPDCWPAVFRVAPSTDAMRSRGERGVGRRLAQSLRVHPGRKRSDERASFPPHATPHRQTRTGPARNAATPVLAPGPLPRSARRGLAYPPPCSCGPRPRMRKRAPARRARCRSKLPSMDVIQCSSATGADLLAAAIVHWQSAVRGVGVADEVVSRQTIRKAHAP